MHLLDQARFFIIGGVSFSVELPQALRLRIFAEEELGQLYERATDDRNAYDDEDNEDGYELSGHIDDWLMRLKAVLGFRLIGRVPTKHGRQFF